MIRKRFQISTTFDNQATKAVFLDEIFHHPPQKNICFGLAWINARCPPKPLYHSPSSAGQGRRSMMKGSRVEIRTGRDHSPITVMDKTD